MDPDEAPLVTLAEALAEIAPVCLPMPAPMPRPALEQPPRWWPAAPQEERTAQPLRALIVVVAPKVQIVAPAKPEPEPDPRDVELAQLRERAEKAEAQLKRMQLCRTRHVTAEERLLHAGTPHVVSTSEPPLPLLSATMAGRFGITCYRRSRWQRLTAMMRRWMGGAA